MTIEEFQKQVHQTAVEKGWWESGNRNYGEVCSLFHSEISEAYDEFKKGFRLPYYNTANPKKPEGAFVELADFSIRVFDYAEFNNINMLSLMNIIDSENIIDEYLMFCGNDYNKLCVTLHKLISDSFELYRIHKTVKKEYLEPIAIAMNIVFNFVSKEVDFMDILILKALYNNTRSYRHGNKKA